MKRSIAAMLLVLCGCVTTGTTRLPSENITRAYNAGRFTFGTSSGPVDVLMRYRIFESSGKTAMCMQAIGTASIAQGDLFNAYFKEAKVMLGEDEFGTGGFIQLTRPEVADQLQASCARSELAWKSSHAASPVSWRAGQVRVVH